MSPTFIDFFFFFAATKVTAFGCFRNHPPVIHWLYRFAFSRSILFCAAAAARSVFCNLLCSCTVSLLSLCSSLSSSSSSSLSFSAAAIHFCLASNLLFRSLLPVTNSSFPSAEYSDIVLRFLPRTGSSSNSSKSSISSSSASVFVCFGISNSPHFPFPFLAIFSLFSRCFCRNSLCCLCISVCNLVHSSSAAFHPILNIDCTSSGLAPRRCCGSKTFA